jgi:hypothetical protein
MKKTFEKLTALVLAILIGLGTGIVAGDIHAEASDSSMPIFIMASDFGTRHDGKTETLGAQTASSSVSLPADTVSSSNWAGYVDTPASGDSYTSVSASWTVPDISDSFEGSAAAQWVGLGGYSTSDLLQIGTLEYISGGEVCYAVFYEKLPDVAQQIADISAGSSITASVSEAEDSSDTWNLTYTVVTASGNTETSTVSVTLDSSYAEEIGTSAEWISEDPATGNNQLYPMADMGTITYTSATVNGDALNASDNTVEPIALVSNNEVLMYPSSVGADGMSFSTEICDEAYGTSGTDSGWNGFDVDDSAPPSTGTWGFDTSGSTPSSQYPASVQRVSPSKGNGGQIDRRAFGSGFPEMGMR